MAYHDVKTVRKADNLRFFAFLVCFKPYVDNLRLYFYEKLFEEMKNAYNGIGDAVKKRDDVHKMAEANKAFSHFRF